MAASPGFTLVELMVTVTVAVILLSIGVPAMQDLIARQRVRAAAGELMTDLAYARADAISNGRRVAVARLDQGSGGAWRSGWRLLACRQTPSACASCDPTDPAAAPACLEETIHRQALPGRVKVCARMNPAAAVVDTPAIVFGPDGRISSATPGADLSINAFMVSDDMGDADAGNDKMRALEFATAGRVRFYEVNSAQGGVACP